MKSLIAAGNLPTLAGFNMNGLRIFVAHHALDADFASKFAQLFTSIGAEVTLAAPYLNRDSFEEVYPIVKSAHFVLILTASESHEIEGLHWKLNRLVRDNNDNQPENRNKAIVVKLDNDVPGIHGFDLQLNLSDPNFPRKLGKLMNQGLAQRIYSDEL